jgi:hypothetical protein
VTIQKHTAEEIVTTDKIVSMLPNKPNEALNVLASIVEACTHAIGEPLETFIDRVLAWRDSRL